MYRRTELLLLLLIILSSCILVMGFENDDVEDKDICKRKWRTRTAARCSKEYSEMCCPNVRLHNGSISKNNQYLFPTCPPSAKLRSSCKKGFYWNWKDVKVTRCPLGYYCPKGIECIIPCAAGSFCPGHTGYKLHQNGTECRKPKVGGVDFRIPTVIDGVLVCPGASESSRCKKGYYCPKPWIMKKCPPGKKCLKGFSFSLRCNMFSPDCSFLDGADVESLIGIILLVVLAFVVFMALLLRFRMRRRSLVLREEMKYFLQDEIQSDEECRASSTNQSPMIPSNRAHKVSANQSPLLLGGKVVARKHRAKSRSHFNIPNALWSSLKVDITGYRENLPKIKSAFTIQVEDYTFTLKSGVKLLRGVDATFQHSKVNVVMGPSGCGKSTLIRSIMGYNKDYGETTGTLQLNGVQVPNLSKIKTYVGYLTQHDTMHENLTVKEILTYQAMLKLPDEDKTNEYVTSSVTEVIRLLALNQIGDRVVGHLDDNLISGGQRRRLSIGKSYLFVFS